MFLFFIFICINSYPNNEVKAKKMRTRIHSPSSSNIISQNISSNSNKHMNSDNNHSSNNYNSSNRMTQSFKMAVETNYASQMIDIVECYLPNALKIYLDKNVKKNKPVPNTIPYVLPTKVNDLFSLIINSWDFFKKGYPSFYGNEPLNKTIETQSLFNKYRNQSQDLTKEELLKIGNNLDVILEICEGLEGREVSIKRRKELKNIKEMIKKK